MNKLNPIEWSTVLARLPLIAILRGVQPEQVCGVGDALQRAGFLCVEVPLNSPRALSSIKLLRDRFPGGLLVGAGTVLTVAELQSVADAGAQFMVAPNVDRDVLRAARDRGLVAVPGFFTASEAFAALAAGANGLKLFPAEAATPAVVKALRAVLPREIPIFPVGGISPQSLRPYLEAGATGFGIGSALYRVDATPDEVYARASAFVAAWNTAH